MADPKPFASLSPTLLARKGGAKPAMRSQLSAVTTIAEVPPVHLVEEDLGWNDMGHGEVVPIHGEAAEFAPSEPTALPVPEVVRQQRTLTRQVERDRRSALSEGRRAAFTLRLDPDRHLKLRLACTIRNRSAQQLVTEALDRLLDELPELADLAAQVAKKQSK